jgi:hypothetical protein
MLFMWLALMNKVLTWEIMQKRARWVPGICILCREEEETITHLLIRCSYVQQFLTEVDQFTGVKDGWISDSVE